MSNLEGSTELANAIAKTYRASLIGVEIVIAVAAVFYFAAMAPGAIALIVLGAAALLLILGTAAFHALTCAIKAHYAANRGRGCSGLWVSHLCCSEGIMALGGAPSCMLTYQ